MVIEKTKLEFSEKDLLLLIADHYGLDPKKSLIRINSYDGDQREPSYTSIIVEGEKIPIFHHLDNPNLTPF